MATPLDARSAIGRMSVRVAEAMAARGHQVRLLALDLDPPPLRQSTSLPVEFWRDIDLASAQAGAEIVVANIGDHFPFHAGVYRLLAEAPVVGIFHDFYLYDLFWGRLVHEHGVSPAAAQIHDQGIIDTYGAAARPLAPEARSGRLSQAAIASQIPMTEWFARRCRAAVAHSDFYAERLGNSCAGPVGVAPLPWPPRGIPAPPPRPAETVAAITVGVMNRNKCVEEVIRAIAASPLLRERLRYDLVGPVEPDERTRLAAIAADLGVCNVTFHGPVDDANLERHLEASDIVCCLRNPVLEGASASAIEGLLSGRPIVVADAGFYADLPDNLAFKVAADVPIPALTAILERLVEDEPLRRETGARARSWAVERFNLNRYVDVLEDIVIGSLEAGPILLLGEQLGSELRTWGIDGDDPVVERLSTSLAVLGGRPPPSP